MQKMYNGEMMRVLRSFTFNGEQYVDLRNQAGEDFESVSASELGKNKPAQKKQTKKVHKIIFTKGEDKNVFELDSPEYNKFISDNKLNEAMIQNCIKGVVKTHKGYTITEEK